MKKCVSLVLIGVASACLFSCSPKTVFLVDSDAQVTFDQRKGVYKVEWIFSSKYQRHQTDTVYSLRDSVESQKNM